MKKHSYILQIKPCRISLRVETYMISENNIYTCSPLDTIHWTTDLRVRPMQCNSACKLLFNLFARMCLKTDAPAE